MKSRLILLMLALHAGAALAQYKCTAANGAITFQQTPCFGAKKEEKLDVQPNGHPRGAASAASATPPAEAASGEGSVDKRMLARYEKQHQRDALDQAVQAAQDDIARRASQRAADLAAARAQFGANPADAQALANALSAIDLRYRAMGEIDASRLADAQAALDKWRSAQ